MKLLKIISTMFLGISLISFGAIAQTAKSFPPAMTQVFGINLDPLTNMTLNTDGYFVITGPSNSCPKVKGKCYFVNGPADVGPSGKLIANMQYTDGSAETCTGRITLDLEPGVIIKTNTGDIKIEWLTKWCKGYEKFKATVEGTGQDGYSLYITQ